MHDNSIASHVDDTSAIARLARFVVAHRLLAVPVDNSSRGLRLQASPAMNTNPLTLPSDLDHQELAG
jgi:hypothetical protein